MTKTLTNFLSQLSTDVKLVESFKQDPAATMKKYGVSDEHQQLVLDQKYDEIQSLLGANYDITKNQTIKAFKN